MNFPPMPSYEQNLEELEKVLKNAFDRILKQLESIDPMDYYREELYTAQLLQISWLLQELNDELYKWIEQTLNGVVEDSVAVALVSAGMAPTLAEAKNIGFTLIDRNRVQAIVNDTFQDVLKATTYMDNSLKDMIRQVQADVIRLGVAQQRNSVDIARELRQKLTDKGLSKSLLDNAWKGIIDARGRRWDLTVYSKMVARTKLQQTQVEGQRMVSHENEHDLAIISEHGAKDSCRHFEGMIISLEGRTAGYPTYNEIRNTQLIFHPNCQHYVHLLGDLDALPASVKKKAEDAKRSAKRAMANPKAFKREDNRYYYEKHKKKRKRRK